MKAADKRQSAVTTRRKRKLPPQVDLAARAERRARFRRAGRTCGVLALAVTAVGGVGYGIHTLTSPETFPLQAVRFDSELDRLRETDLRAALNPHLDGGFLGLDVARIRMALQELAWIEVASVRRVWPGMLRVTIREQEAVAVWNDEALLSARGEIFSPPRATWPQGLMELAGPDNRAESVALRLQQLKPVFSDVGHEISALAVDERESWTVTLEGGATIALGREDVDDRIERFSEMYRGLVTQRDEMLASADLRYPNGFAILWADAPEKKK